MVSTWKRTDQSYQFYNMLCRVFIDTFAEGYENDHPDNGQVEGQLKLERHEAEWRRPRSAALQHPGPSMTDEKKCTKEKKNVISTCVINLMRF